MSEGLNVEVFGQTYNEIKGIRVSGVGADAPIYEYIVPTGTIAVTNNGTIDITKYAEAFVDVDLSGINLQSKTVTPNESQIIVQADEGYNGLGTVTINSISPNYIGSGISRNNASNITISNAIIDVPAGYYNNTSVALTKTGVNIIPSTSIQTITPQSDYHYINTVTVQPIPTSYVIPSGTLNIMQNTITSVATYAMVYVNVNNSVTPTYQAKTVTPSSTVTTVVADIGYDALSVVTVAAIPSQYIVPTGELPIYYNGVYDVTNTASVEVDVAGSSTTPNLQRKNATPSTSQITVTPDNGYDGLASVTIAAIPSQYIIPTGAKNITVNGTNIDVKKYATVNVSVAGSNIDYQDGDVLLYGEPPSSIVGVAKVGNAYVGTEE